MNVERTNVISPLDQKRVGRLLAERPDDPDGFADRERRAASFILLYEDEGTKVMLVKKKTTPGYRWSGQIGMVGGFIEPEDGSDLDAAYRELDEELQLPRGDVETLGSLGHFPTQIAMTSVHVFVGYWDGKRTPVPEPSEIARVVPLHLETLLHQHARYGYSGRHAAEIGGLYLRYPTRSGDIWGVTGRTMHALLELLANGQALA